MLVLQYEQSARSSAALASAGGPVKYLLFDLVVFVPAAVELPVSLRSWRLGADFEVAARSLEDSAVALEVMIRGYLLLVVPQDPNLNAQSDEGGRRRCRAV